MFKLLLVILISGILSPQCCLATGIPVGVPSCNESKLQEIGAALLKQHQQQLNEEKLIQQLGVKVTEINAGSKAAHASIEKSTQDISDQLSTIQSCNCDLSKQKESELEKRIQNVETMLGITFGQDKTTCQPNFRPFQSKCYHFGVRAMDWYTAKIACQQLGATLASVETYIEDDFISRTIKTIPGSNSLFGFWTSGNDIQSNNQWTWDATSKAFGAYRSWGAGEPSSGAGQCMFYYRHDDWHWHDLPCTSAYTNGEGTGFVCEKDA